MVSVQELDGVPGLVVDPRPPGLEAGDTALLAVILRHPGRPAVREDTDLTNPVSVLSHV
ncbi:MAG: hypothetical protein WCV84_02785 [Patescibacteria group bacterium]